MADTATTEGSIVGYLRLNTSDWNEQLDRAEARARELSRTDPTITVDANIGDAMSKIETVKAAEASLGGKDVSITGGSPAKIDSVAAAQKRLEVAERAAANAASTQYLAELRLEDVQGRRNKSAYALAAAEEAVARASRNAEAAESRHLVATTALTEAQQAAARSAMEEAAAEEVEAAATGKSNEAKGLAVNRTGLLIAAVAALIPMLSPLAGFAIGAGGALAGMGAAGILAIVGISSAIQRADQTGRQYSAGLQTLKADLNELGGTAATGMLGWFQQAIRDINAEMPFLNTQVGHFTELLGSAGVQALQGVLTALHVLNPLFLQSGVYIDQIAAGFQKWTSDGGLQRFANDAIQTFPMVTNAIGSILSVTMHLIEVLAPVGGIMLTVLTGAADLGNVLLNVLQPPLVVVATGALAVWGAFKLWDGVAPKLLTAGKAAVEFAADFVAATGPVGALGIAVAAVTFAIIGWNAVMAAQKAFAQAGALAVQDYTAAIIADSGAVKENTLAMIAKDLHDSGAIENAHKLGLTTGTLTQAILGNKQALAAVNEVTKAHTNGSKEQEEQLKATGLSLSDLGIAQEWVRDAVKNNTQSVKEGVTTYKAIKDAQDSAAGSSKDAAAAQKALAGTYGMSVEQLSAAQDAQKQNADAAAATTRQLQLENDAAQLLTNAFTLLNGGTLNVAQAQTGAAAATNSLVDALKSNGLEIDGNTKAAVANQQAIQQKVAADQQAAEAIAKQTGSTEAGTKAFGDAKVALEQQLAAQGLLNPAVQAYIDKLYAIPPVAKTSVELNADAAIKRAQELKAWLDSLTPKTVVVTVQTNNVGAPANMGPSNTIRKDAAGGPIYRALGGGVGNPFAPYMQGTDTVPAMLTPGEFVVKEKSASYDPQFMKAYNADPASALASVRGNGGGAVEVSLAGATITMDIDGQAVTGIIRKQTLGVFDQLTQQLNGGIV